jgi:diguanylate cyclase (GGDEF)-like protein
VPSNTDPNRLARRHQRDTHTLLALRDDIVLWMRYANLQDLVNSQRHSADFNGSRAEFIHSRVRPLAFIFAILTPLWIPIDYWLMPADKAWILAGFRIAAGSLFFALALWTTDRFYLLWLARLRLGLLMLIPAVFYVCASLFCGDINSGAMTGYSFFPYLLVSMQAVFALTLLEGLAYALPVIALEIGLHAWQQQGFSSGLIEAAWLLVLLASIAMWAGMAQLHMLMRLYRQATRDSLTGLFNRGALTISLQQEANWAQRYNRPLTVLLMDLDRFKRINDSYGHLTGDLVLQTFALTLEEQLRKADIIGRYGGEEFIAVLPETGLPQAEEVAERVRAACHLKNVAPPDHGEVNFTTSIGVTQLRPNEDLETMLARVDEALYSAKAAGRDCVIVAP